MELLIRPFGKSGLPWVVSAPPVERVMVEQRAASFAKRSIKEESKRMGLELAVSMMDLTTLEGMDTEGKVRQLCRKAMAPMDAVPGAAAAATVAARRRTVP